LLLVVEALASLGRIGTVLLRAKRQEERIHWLEIDMEPTSTKSKKTIRPIALVTYIDAGRDVVSTGRS